MHGTSSTYNRVLVEVIEKLAAPGETTCRSGVKSFSTFIRKQRIIMSFTYNIFCYPPRHDSICHFSAARRHSCQFYFVV